MSISRALISVSDKSGLDSLAKGLHEHDVEILSTGGTAKFIADLGIPVVEVSDFTGFPELFDGRVKTLHPKVHGGLLHRRDIKEHVEQANENVADKQRQSKSWLARSRSLSKSGWGGPVPPRFKGRAGHGNTRRNRYADAPAKLAPEAGLVALTGDDFCLRVRLHTIYRLRLFYR